MEAALVESARIEAACSTWNAESEWSRLNATGGARLDAEWVVLLSEAKAWTEKTGGAFDPVLGRLVDSWGARRGGRVPGPEELQAAKLASGAPHLHVDCDRVELSDGAWIEEGGFLKGYALDRMKTKLEANGARSGLLDFGGQLLAWGKAIPVSVADPLDRQRPRFTFSLENASLSSFDQRQSAA